MAAYTRLLTFLDRAAGLAVIVTMIGMVAVVSVQVLLRYVFNTSLDWAEDIGRLFFVWAMFLAIPIGVGQGAHIAIELLTARLAADTRVVLLRVTSTACAAMMIVVAWQAAILIVQQWDELMTTVDLTVALFMIPVAVGAAHAALHFGMIAVRGGFARTRADTE